MVLAGALVGGATDLRASNLIVRDTFNGTWLGASVLLAILSLVGGACFLCIRFIEAEAVRRITVKSAPTLDGKGKPYRVVLWQWWGVVGLHAMPWVLAGQAVLWLAGAVIYGSILMRLL